VSLGVDLDTLDGGDGTSTLGEDTGLRKLLDDGREELVRNAEDNESRALKEEGEKGSVRSSKEREARGGKGKRTLTHSVREGTATRLSGRTISGR
jgi:hypothetical protein